MGSEKVRNGKEVPNKKTKQKGKKKLYEGRKRAKERNQQSTIYRRSV
jgi:hypothetical protein